jgi:murein DD-endopeptidase MepM/ murein hydrolase activator NlpD
VPFAPTASVPAVVGPTVPLAPGPATGDAAAGGDQDEAAIAALRARDLRLPIDGVEVERLKGMFGQPRGENPAHEAVDILAPRNTPIHAVEDGTIAKLFTSNAGGLTIYQYDPGQRFCYYYAHLERYADGLGDGRQVARGEVIGFVGTSGDAPADTPHLHFAILEVGAERHWWGGRAIDPYLVFK